MSSSNTSQSEYTRLCMTAPAYYPDLVSAVRQWNNDPSNKPHDWIIFTPDMPAFTIMCRLWARGIDPPLTVSLGKDYDALFSMWIRQEVNDERLYGLTDSRYNMKTLVERVFDMLKTRPDNSLCQPSSDCTPLDATYKFFAKYSDKTVKEMRRIVQEYEVARS